MEDLVSIIVPVYNVEKYLDDCIKSLINQTYKNIEIIIINDGSTDGSFDIINGYKQIDERIVVINRENKGVLFSRVEGYKKATGKYITFVDSDDWIEQDTIEILYKNITKYNADVIKCDFAYNDSMEPSGNLLNIGTNKFICREKFEPEFYDMLLKRMNIHTVWAQMFKKELLYNNIDNIDTTITLGDDLEFNVQLYKNISNILFIDNVLYHYRYNPSSITRKLNEKNIKNNIISVTKSYLSAYGLIDYLKIKDAVLYKQHVILHLLDEINKWQIDLIGILKDKSKSVEYLKWYYCEYDKMKYIKEECDKLELDTSKLKYNIFYKNIYIKAEIAYIVGRIIYNIKKIYRKLKLIKILGEKK